MSNCKLKNIKETSIINSDNNSEKQFELVFESNNKLESIQLSGQGDVKATVSV